MCTRFCEEYNVLNKLDVFLQVSFRKYDTKVVANLYPESNYMYIECLHGVRT